MDIDHKYEIEEKEKNRKVLLLSLLLHFLILFFVFLPWVSTRAIDEMDEPMGILVQFEAIEGAEAPPFNNVKSEVKPSPKPQEEEIKPAVKETKAQELKTEVAEIKSKTVIEEEAELAATKEDIEAKEKAEADRKKAIAKAKAEAERKEAERLEAERKRAEEEAFNNSKSKFSDLFGNGSQGEGKDNTDNPNGDPDASKLDQLVSGKGTVGTGLTGRAIVYEPTISDHSQKSGRVVIRVCVNKSGNVISKNFTQKGSTTTDSYLVKLAMDSAAKYKFSESEIAEQCGIISIDFKLK